MKSKRTKEERATALAPIINEHIAEFYRGNEVEGVSAFQARILSAIKDLGLCERRHVHAMKAAVHHHNREKAGLVPFDVHDLLNILLVKGWDDAETSKALACESHSACAIPPLLSRHAPVFRAALLAQARHTCHARYCERRLARSERQACKPARSGLADP